MSEPSRKRSFFLPSLFVGIAVLGITLFIFTVPTEECQQCSGDGTLLYVNGELSTVIKMRAMPNAERKKAVVARCNRCELTGRTTMFNNWEHEHVGAPPLDKLQIMKTLH